MDKSLLGLAAESVRHYYSEYLTGITIFEDGSILAWFNSLLFHSVALALNLVHNALVGDDYRIDVTNAPLRYDETNNFKYSLLDRDIFTAIILLALPLLASTLARFYIKVCIHKDQT